MHATSCAARKANTQHKSQHRVIRTRCGENVTTAASNREEPDGK